MIKTKTTTNFSFQKLNRELDSILEKHIFKLSDNLADMAKEKIKSGSVRPALKPITKKTRKKRGTGFTPLFESGALYNSIKPTKKGQDGEPGVDIFEYGTLHERGFTHKSGTQVKARRFLFTASANLPPKLKKKYKALEKSFYLAINKSLSKYRG